MTIEFHITRQGVLTADDVIVGSFGTVDAAADMAIRFAQDQDTLYRIFYPL